ncbi:Heterokaryon incompatibility protein 6, OR allele [Fusarium oxysporum f. sp. albedinis]|nr:Heterokaryon incompatibility protein 6, OR allele [Fusarium oxysporum f. sp. albedinis]
MIQTVIKASPEAATWLGPLLLHHDGCSFLISTSFPFHKLSTPTCRRWPYHVFKVPSTSRVQRSESPGPVSCRTLLSQRQTESSEKH